MDFRDTFEGDVRRRLQEDPTINPVHLSFEERTDYTVGIHMFLITIVSDAFVGMTKVMRDHLSSSNPAVIAKLERDARRRLQKDSTISFVHLSVKEDLEDSIGAPTYIFTIVSDSFIGMDSDMRDSLAASCIYRELEDAGISVLV
ncbi:hypothetical protein GGI08_002721 [Coemansia sp. S2]|nr:hypothetical protein GGI08_002721 [Coemansia sp. S2]